MRRALLSQSPVLVAALLMVSGACALTYQVAWLRLLRLVFGYSTAASAAVLGIFMAGLGIGAIVLGRRADRHAHPLRLYASLELAIALSAAATPLLIDGARALYITVGGTERHGLASATLLRLILSSAVLAVPTFFMGGTLSAAARAVEIGSGYRRRTALLYAGNTIGAVSGVLLANFVLLERYGTRRTLLAAAAVNGVLALLVLMLAPAPRRAVPSPRTGAAEVAPAGTTTTRFLLCAAGIAGFAFLLMELIWYRTLAPLLGGSTYTFGIILAIALLGIGFGSLLYAIEPPTARRVSLGRLALISALEALCAIAPFALGDRVALLAMALQPLSVVGFSAQVLIWTVIAAIVIFPMACLSGYQFSLLVGLLGARAETVGREVGQIYASNTTGAIAGSLAGGFGFVPLLGALGAWRAVALLLVALALAATWLAWRQQESHGLSLAGVAIALVTLVLCGARGPTAVWRHTPIGAGLARSFGSTTNGVQAYLHDVRRSLYWEVDGLESSVAVTDTNGLSLIMNGKSDGNAVTDASTMIMTGMLPALLHEQPKRALVIGLGLGSTAGWLSRVPAIDQVDVVELEPAVIDAARDAAAVNFDVLANPKVRIVIGDAREYLLTTRARYDLIISEPSNPYRAGVASLFTHEYYQAAQRALADDGVFAQWVQAYAVDAATVRTVYATLATVFDSVESWEVQLGSDLLLLARARDAVHDLEEIAARLTRDPFRQALGVAWGVSGVHGLYTGFVAGPPMARSIRATTPAVRLNTDDATLIEFELARSLGQADPQLLRAIRDRAAQQPELAPATRNGTIDWTLVSELRAARALHEEKPFSSAGFSGDNAATERMRARVAYGSGRLDEARAAWAHQAQEPQHPIDIILTAEAWADAGDPRCAPLAERARVHSEADAETILARCLERNGQLADAADHLGRAWRAARSSAWGYRPLLQRSLDLAWRLASSQAEVVAPLLANLREPFAARVLEDRRRLAYASIALHYGPPHDCSEAIADVEPDVLWDLAFLEQRAQCYERVGSPHLHRARRDLAAFRSAAPRPFDSAPQ